MPTNKIQSISANPDASAHLALSDLALNAAIELERFQLDSHNELRALSELSKAVSERSLADLALMPVYDRALASGGQSGASSKSDLYSRLQNIASKMQSTNRPSHEDVKLLRDFCVALHDALLTNRLETLRGPIASQRRIS